MRDKKVLAERKAVFESKFNSFLNKAVAAPYFFELQKTFVTEKAENAIVVEMLAMASGFKIAAKYSVRTIIEVYQPDSAVA
mmetsp:Transcript_21814/g.26895  ORF Transcript_21814/g.26895 Transcript_21814/m.26895 type:complete len:81 (-) Transcript_21814:645-887(-)